MTFTGVFKFGYIRKFRKDQALRLNSFSACRLGQGQFQSERDRNAFSTNQKLAQQTTHCLYDMRFVLEKRVSGIDAP